MFDILHLFATQIIYITLENAEFVENSHRGFILNHGKDY